MKLSGIFWFVELLYRGEFGKLLTALRFDFYRMFYELVFWFDIHSNPRYTKSLHTVITLKTKYPVAWTSPDHLIPWGTKNDNSTHKKFVLHTETFIGESTLRHQKSFLDLGCSGGQLVKDFRAIGWISVGLEGSDYSLRHGRAHWRDLAGVNLFTCDIAKPFTILTHKKQHAFDLITAWEVLEHIKTTDLPVVFKNIVRHLKRGGYFIASTTSLPDTHNGVDLHQTKMTNDEWATWIKSHVPELTPADDGLSYYQRVRYNFEHSYLIYQKR